MEHGTHRLFVKCITPNGYGVGNDITRPFSWHSTRWYSAPLGLEQDQLCTLTSAFPFRYASWTPPKDFNVGDGFFLRRFLGGFDSCSSTIYRWYELRSCDFGGECQDG